ncbi:MAG: methyltransferase [Candidatus Tectimicrobiota bacterium]
MWWTGLADAPVGSEALALHTLGLGFMASRTLHVALEMRLFTHLAPGPQTLPQVAQSLQLAERAAGRLLAACAALGLLRATPDGFANTPLSARYLVEGKATFIGSYLALFDTLGYERWAQLSQALRHNGPLDACAHPYQYLAEQPDAAQTFSAAQHAGSRSLGRALARRIDFAPFTCLLDLGGGSGAYTVELLRHYPQLCAILVDFPAVCQLADTVMQEEGLTARVRTVGADYEHDPLPGGADVVLWSGNLHASSPERCQHILTRLRAALPPHGLLLIHDYLLDEHHAGALIPALLGLHMTLVSPHGQVYSAPELRALLLHAGFTDIQVQPFLPGHSSLITARPGPQVR